MYASELCGEHIGNKVEYYRGGRFHVTGEITMITHKKNGNVIIRHSKASNTEVKGTQELEPLTPPTYYATL